MRLSAKIALMGASSVLITAVALVLLSIWQSGQYNRLAQNEVDLLIEADLDHITQGVYNLVRTEDEAVQLQVDNNLKVARYLLAGSGGVSLANELAGWTAVNQFTRESRALKLPRFLIGGRWLGQNTDPAIETPVVDEVVKLVGETATIFQRINEQGDMLRVATTVKTEANQRAIGSYIPAVNPDGAENPVIAAILKGATYHGRAYVVNAWYLTAYEPINDATGHLVGMLYVGVKQELVASRVRNAILQNNVGKTGYVYVLGGAGEDRGRYIISYKGERDGEDIWSNRDSDGRHVIQEIISRATDLEPGEMTTVRYRWQNLGEAAPRWKIARLAYYAPWDWVIGTSVYEDELQTYRSVLSGGRTQMVRIMGLAGFVITVLVGLLGMFVAWSITRPVRQMTQVAEKIIGGDFNQIVQANSSDEIGVLAQTFNLMTSKLSYSMNGLRESEEKYRGIVENAIEGLFQSTIEGRFISANPALADILGYDSPEELIASVTDIRRQLYVNPNDRDTLLKTISQQGGKPRFERQFYRRDRTKIWVSISARMIYDDTGNPAVIEGFLADVTARKQAEEALAESRNYLDEVINAVGDPLFVKDRKHRWVLVNNALCAFMGRNRNELLGKTDFDFFPKTEAEVFWDKDSLVLASGRVNFNEEDFTDAKGIVHSILTKKTLYTDKTGEQFIVGIIRDITDQKQAEEERKRLEARLGQAQKMEAIGTLAGGIAHDFNNILAGIMGYTEILQRSLTAVATPEINRFLTNILSATERARDLIRQILVFSRPSATELRPVLLRQAVEEAVGLIRASLPTTVVIEPHLDSQAFVLADEVQLHQIIMNLCSNASQAMEDGKGVLTIRLEDVSLDADFTERYEHLIPGEYVHIQVNDTGRGIPEHLLDRVFEPFFTTKKKGEGTGLGLSMVHGIVSNMNGLIEVASPKGQGTQFDIYLPTVALVENVPKAALQPSPTGHEHLVLVDDDPFLVEIGKEMTEALGYRVTSFVQSVEALDYICQHGNEVDLIVTDLTMPGLTGLDLARSLQEKQIHLPIILCTGHDEQLSAAALKAIGIKAIMLKPVSVHNFAEMIRKVIDRVID
ncbi:MAG: Cache 3/Cache 2 fusion domain-containing protein [Desulfobulbaceae bacterium]|jgi:PAS domain S-box-containing protein|nr:Cache 3/Cache 2 fusion domain-containing protein [Desulfobulbaceae bacterium]